MEHPTDQAVNAAKTCVVCGQSFASKRNDAKFCSSTCRSKATRTIISEVGTHDEKFDQAVVKAIRDIPLIPKDGFVSTGEPEKYDREANLKAFEAMGLGRIETISTGIPDFDALTMIPKGRITQIQGKYGVGKTTLCLNMLRGMTDKKVFYIDSEAALNPELLVSLELHPKNFTLFNNSNYMEDIAEAIRGAASSGLYDLVIFDSLAATTTRAEAEGAITDANIGQKAKLMHKLIHLTQMEFKRTNTAFVVINQEREVIGSYTPQKYTPGGTAVPFAASLIVSLKTIPSWKFPKDAKHGAFQGHEVEAKIIKSRMGGDGKVAKFKLYYPDQPHFSYGPVDEETGEYLDEPAPF